MYLDVTLFWCSLEKSQATKGYVYWCNTVLNAKHVWTHQLCVAQAGSATLAETLKSEKWKWQQRSALSAAAFNDATVPTPLARHRYTSLYYCTVNSVITTRRKFCAPVRFHVTENSVIRIPSDQKISGTTFHLVFSHWSLKHRTYQLAYGNFFFHFYRFTMHSVDYLITHSNT